MQQNIKCYLYYLCQKLCFEIKQKSVSKFMKLITNYKTLDYNILQKS